MTKRIIQLAMCSALLGACTDEGITEVSQETAGSGAVAKKLASAALGLSYTDVKFGGTHAKVDGPTTLVMQEIVLAPGGHTGWHSHSGLAFASIVTGTLTLFDGDAPCVGTAYPAGTAFVDPGGTHNHIARNLTDASMTVRVQYVTPTGAPVRIDVPAPPGAEACP
ncbi:MAG: hypothetical protein WKG01_03645 [Kofleriaceae bacterium]